MRRSSFFSLVIAVVLASLAVFGARGWLDQQRLNILAANRPPKAKINQIVIAGNSLRFGDRLTAGKLKLINWPVGSKPVGVFSTIEEVVGSGEDEARFVMAAIETDEPILSSKITVPGQRAKLSSVLSEDMKAISIRVNDVLGVAGFVFPGDRVDVLLTRGRKRSYVDVLLQGVKVLAIDQSADDRRDKAKVVRTVTFEVSTFEAQKLTLAARVGTLSLALRNVASSGFEVIDRVSLQDLSGGELSQTLAQEVAKQNSGEDEKLANIEKLVKDVGDNLSDRINQLESNKLTVVERPKPVISRPAYSIVGVTRGGKRKEYRFESDGLSDGSSNETAEESTDELSNEIEEESSNETSEQSDG